MRKIAFLFTILFTLFFLNISFSQPQGTNPVRPQPTFTFYGKIVDSHGKGVEFASVQLAGTKFDTLTKISKSIVIAGQLTEPNGDFYLENVSAGGELTLKVFAMGYDQYEQKIAMGSRTAGQPGPVMKDLGNIKLNQPAVQLSEVQIDGSVPTFEMKIDKKVYNVEKNALGAGGTAEDVLKSIPSVSVDVDNNVTMRGSSPQIFVDGRPTTLTIDQIPADVIEEIEIITNPSAKYDASGGSGGILNIVLKKNRKIGYNGNVRAGVNTRGSINAGGDINIRQNKMNFFISANLNQRKSYGTSESTRRNFYEIPNTLITQEGESVNKGYFSTGRTGMDIFLTNRSTLTLSGMFTRGQFNPHEETNIQSDTLAPAEATGFSGRISDTKRSFQNLGGTISFKHLFPKDGREWTADFNYNDGTSENEGAFETQNYQSDGSFLGSKIMQQQKGDGRNQFITSQTDFVNPIKNSMKMEAGARVAIRNYESANDNFLYNSTTNDFELIPEQSDNYKFNDQVYAAYVTFSNQVNKLGYQAGLRVESSFYTGEQILTARTFENEYPLSFFPSGFLSYKLNDKNDFQLNYTRRINRPNFFQLIPYTDYSDSLNLTRGNPGLKPEFTNSVELSWQKTMSKKHSLLTSLYFKNTNDLITRYQSFEFDSVYNKEVLISTFRNADASYAYGIEATYQKGFNDWLNGTLNVNAYNSFINGENIESNLSTDQFSWFAKLNLDIKPVKKLTVQLSAEYKSKTSLQTNSSGGGRSGFGGGPSSTAQGYMLPNFELDLALRYELVPNKATLTVSVSDMLATDKNQSHSESNYFIQDSKRVRDTQIVRLSFSYRFGKFDSSLFKRKNTRERENNDMDMGM